MFDILKESYNDEEFQMQFQDFQNYKGTEVEKGKAFVEGISKIILSKLNKSTKKLQKRFEGDIMVGDWYSFTNYLKVLKIGKKDIEVKNQRGMIWTVSKDILEHMSSANHFEKEIACTRTQLVEIL